MPIHSASRSTRPPTVTSPGVAEALLGRPLPPIARRWSGVYAESTTGELVHRAAPDPLLWVVTGPGGRGMALCPALAEQTADQLGL